MKIYNIFRAKIASYFGSDADVQTAGSFATELFLPTSDFNIHVNFHYKTYTEDELSKAVTSFVAFLANDKSLVSSMYLENKANIFILKLSLSKDHNNQVVEIIFKIGSSNSSLRNDDIIKKYLNYYPTAKPLYLLFRGLVHRAKLDNPSTGGINTFALFLMVIAFIQKMEVPPTCNNTLTKVSAEVSTSNENLTAVDQSYKSQRTLSTITKDRHEKSVNYSNCVTVDYSHLGPTFASFLYFYAYSFDYQHASICPHQPSQLQGESTFPVS